jgi:hypothetical protein
MILLPVGTYKLRLKGHGENAAKTCDLDIIDDLTLIERDVATTIIDGRWLDRVFEVWDIATVKISEVTVRNGYLSHSESSSVGCANSAFLIEAVGGGILNCGDLALTNSIVAGNPADASRHYTVCTSADQRGVARPKNGATSTARRAMLSGRWSTNRQPRRNQHRRGGITLV